MTFDVPDPEELYEDNPFSAKKRGKVLKGEKEGYIKIF